MIVYDSKILAHDTNHVVVALFTSFLAAVLVLFWFVVRNNAGLGEPALALQAFLLAVFLVCTPSLVNTLLRRFCSADIDNSWWAAEPFWIAVCLFLVAMAGCTFGHNQIVLIVMGAVAGISLLFTAFHLFKSQGWLLGLIIIIIAGLFWGLWLLPISWAREFEHLFYDSWMVTGSSSDQLYHAAIAAMIKTHGIPSAGIDGVLYLKYHYGSHWIMAQFSSLFNISTIKAYNLLYPVVFIPFCIYMLFSCCLHVKKNIYPLTKNINLKYDLWVWAIFSFVVVGFLPPGAWYFSNPFWSESQAIAIAVICVFISLFSYRCRVSGVVILHGNQGARGIFYIFVLLFLAAWTSVIKISAGYVLTVLVCYLVLRLWRHISTIEKISTLIWVFFFVYLYFQTSSGFGGFFGPASSNISSISYFLKECIPDKMNIAGIVFPARIYYFIIYFIWLWLFLLFRANSNRILSISSLKYVLKEKKIVDGELALILFFAILPTMTLNACSYGYFADVLRVLSSIFLIACVYDYGVKYSKQDYRRWLCGVVFLAVLCFSPMLLSSLRWQYFLFLECVIVLVGVLAVWFIESRFELIGGMLKYLLFFLFLPPVIFCFMEWEKEVRRIPFGAADILQETSSKKYAQKHKLVVRLRALQHELSVEEKRITALYIPKTERVYWDFLSDCKWVTMIAPALTGIAMIDGGPEQSCEKTRLYDFAAYSFSLNSTSNILSTEEICTLAKEKGFLRVIVVYTNKKKDVVTQKINCVSNEP